MYRLIKQAHSYVLNEVAEGLTLARSGFRTVHRYPERVIKEAITNAVIHRDYRLNRDIHISLHIQHVYEEGELLPEATHKEYLLVRPETVADRAAKAARHYLRSGPSVGPYLADQLLLPLALAGGGSLTRCAIGAVHRPSH